MDARWLTEAEVVALVDLADAVEALERALLLEDEGRAANLVKTHLGWRPHHDLHALGGSLEAGVSGVSGLSGLVGTKTWCHTPGGATPLLVLWEAQTGALVAVIEAFALGQLRTAALSAVATDRLARPEAASLGIVGSGRQALGQVAAVAAVRPVEQVKVFSPDPQRRAAFAARVEAELGLRAVPMASVPAAVSDTAVVTLVTRAGSPFLTRTMPAPGTHINAVGAIAPDRMEFEPALLDRCAVVAVDNLPQARQQSRELIQHYDQDGWSAVTALSAVVSSGLRRPAGADLTLFKPLGVGIADLAVGLACLERALEAGIGRPLPQPTRVPPRLSARRPVTTRRPAPLEQ